MKLEHLDEFAALALSLNFSNAAKRLHISPSVLSKHIAALEREIGQQLFVRSTTFVELTPAGRRFYEGISPIIENYHTFMDGFCSGSTPHARQLGIALEVRTTQTLHAAALAAHRVESEAELKVSFLNRAAASHRRGASLSGADAAITYANEKAARESIIVPLKRDPFVAVMPKDHPLAGKDAVSLVEDLSRYRNIRLQDGCFEAGQAAISEAFKRFGVQPDYVYSLASSFDDISLFFDFHEVLILPSEATPLIKAITPETHAVLPFEEDVSFQLSLVYPPQNESEALRLFTEKLKGAVAETDRQTA